MVTNTMGQQARLAAIWPPTYLEMRSNLDRVSTGARQIQKMSGAGSAIEFRNGLEAIIAGTATET